MRDRLILVGLLLSATLLADRVDGLCPVRPEGAAREGVRRWQQEGGSKLFALMIDGAETHAFPPQPQPIEAPALMSEQLASASSPSKPADTRARLISLFRLAPGNSERCVRWAAGDVTNALAAAGVAPRSANIRVAVVPGEVPAEGFELAIRGPMVSVKGGDPVGLMYGLFELSEQIADAHLQGDWHQLAAQLRSTRQRPFLEFRGNNAFVHTTPSGRLFDVPMWEAYIDMLARCRFNVLDLHGLYDEKTTDFPSIYPMLLTLADYPGVGDPAVQAQNLADFKAILAHARQRGVKVAFMNYIVSTPGVAADHLADYTAKAVAKLLQELPDLYMLGFRIGETGQKESFFRDAYLQGVKKSGRQVRLYTRSWLAKQPQLEEIARASSGGLDIEIKYNGEQLGLPYHAIQRVSLLEEPSYSYENYLDVPAPYRIIWQVRANGTHRFWAWEQTGFIRRTVRSLTFGDARGFTLEPHIAYFPFAAASYYQRPADQQVYRWIWQKHWMWYLAWGRLAYNPALPESTIVLAFERRFGPPGREIYQAMQDSGTIVPLALAYRHQGPDHRDHSPETETGTGQGMYRLSGKQEPIPLLKFARNLPLDSRSFVGITPFVEEQLAGQADGRIGPGQVARLLSDAALKTREDVGHVSGLSGHAADEWRLLKTDLLCAAALGEYYAARILGMTHLVYALEADSLADYQQATNFLDQSRADWGRLAQTADPVFAPLNNPLRHQLNFKWASQLPVLEALDATAPKVWEQRKASSTNTPRLQFRPAPGPNDIQVTLLRHDILGHTVRVSCSVSATNGVKSVLLWSKPLPSTESWGSRPMVADGDEYSLTVPLTPHGLLYQVEVRDQKGSAAIFPNVLNETPYRAITPAELR